jgi:peptide chain release factor 3
MELEQKRGISMTSAALEFEIDGRRMTLLDTPGHRDFSEDTYRALVAADSVVMVIDAAKGVEEQTRKLFEVCRRHRLPILTFVNKLDHPSLDALAVVDDVERTLGIAAAPVNWPIGSADRFRGVYDIRSHEVQLYEREAQGQYRAPVRTSGIDDPAVEALIGEAAVHELKESLSLIGAAGAPFDVGEYLAGRQTPMFFGSALTNFGLEPFLDALVNLAPPPGPRLAGDHVVDPRDEQFTGFVFKIQANMDPKHRDRIAFIRVCSGRFTKDMLMRNSRLGEDIRASRAYRFFGREREIIETAYAGDIVGLVNPGRFAIGDTLHDGPEIQFPELPHFPAEHFGIVRLTDLRHKQFDGGMRQLEEEGLMQVFFAASGKREPIVGVVGALQFDVIVARLESEYGVKAEITPAKYVTARWLPAGMALNDVPPSGDTTQAVDRAGRGVLLFRSPWDLQYFERHHPECPLRPEP